MLNPRHASPALLTLIALNLLGCSAVSRVEVGERRVADTETTLLSPTPDVDALFEQRHDIDKLTEALGLYEAWLEEAIGVSGLAGIDSNGLTALAHSRSWTRETYHVTTQLALGNYFLGILAARTKKEALEVFWRSRAFALMGLFVNEEFRAVYEDGSVRLRDTVHHLTIDELDALHWFTSSWARYAENQGVLASVKLVPDGHAGYARALALDPNNWKGYPHRGIGVLYAALPNIMGGDLELGEEHFTRAIEIAPDYLETYVLMAEYIYIPRKNREAFDAYINLVLDAPETDDIYRLDNNIAKEKARLLKEEAEKRF